MGIRDLKSINLGRFRKLIPIPVKSCYFRSVTLKRENEILSTQGSLEHGGRYNPIGEFAALYVGENKTVCKAEIRRKGKDSITAPQIIGKIQISLTKVLDLTSTTNLEILGIEKKDLMVDMKKGGWDLTWNIARLAYRSGYEAIIAPSITGKGNGLIVFDKYIDTTRVKVISKTHL